MDLLNILLDESGPYLLALDCETGLIVDCNEALCRANGLPREYFIGHSAGELHAAYPLRTEEQWKYFIGLIEAGPGLTVDTQFRRADGSFYPVRAECSLHDSGGRRYVVIVSRPLKGVPAVQSHFERGARWQKALYQITMHPAMTAGRFDEAAAFIALTGQSVFPADFCSIWRLQEGRVVFLTDHTGGLRPNFDRPIELAEFPWLETALNSGRCTDIFETCRNASDREKTRALAGLYGAAAVLCAPIRVGGQSWGAMTIGSRTERQWQPDEIGFAGELADQVAHAVSSVELRISRERYRSFVEMSAEAVWRVEFNSPVSVTAPLDEQIDAVLGQGYIADCNQAFARFFDRNRRDEFLGCPLSRLLAPVTEARREELRRMAAAGYQVANLEVRHLVDGEERWALRNVTGIIENGKLIHLWGASRDITERKRAEELLTQSELRYRAFVANSSEGIFRVEVPEPISLDLPAEEVVRRVWDTGVLAECNEALARIRGYQKPEELVGRPGIEFRMRTEDEFQQEVEFIRRGCRMADLERPVRKADGTIAWFNYSLTGVVENGCLARVWGRVADVTARRALEEDLRALSARRATILEQERARIAREIHDELGQQLTALKFEAAAWERGVRKPAKGELTKSIDAAIQSVRRIATELRPAILDHFGLIAAIEWMAGEVSRRTGIECDCDLEAGIEVDRELATTVFRIFQEALTNAARHSGAGMVLVHLRARKGRLELTVQDNGKGFRARPAGQAQSLGLIGMRERARDAGGAIDISGAPGRGTRVAAWFPLASPAIPVVKESA